MPVSFAEFGSMVAELAVALLLMVVLGPGCTVYVAETIFEVPTVMLPSEQGKLEHPPPATPVRARRGGVGSSRETDVASDGPLFVTVILKVTFDPGSAVEGPIFVTERSAF